MKEWIRDFAVAIVIAVLILQFIKPTIVKESSMEPTLYNNNYLLISKQSYGLFGGDPQQGDIIVFQTELKTDAGKDKLLIKRVIGLPGDTVDILEGKVIVNGKILNENYIGDNITMSRDAGTHFEVPENCYFCMGDHRDVSLDSRWLDVGYVERDQIVGKAFIRLFPFTEITLL